MIERSDVARIIWETSRADEGTISATGANHVADALMPFLAEAWDEAVRTMATAGLINSSVLAYGGAPPNPYRSES